MEGIDTEELRKAIAKLPEDIRQELIVQSQDCDTVGIKMELIKFVSELYKHNQGVDWEINKVKQKDINICDIIKGSQELFDFLTE
jgi:hypothetical protein